MSAPQRQGEQASPISPQRRAATASEETQLDNLDLESGARLGNINIEIDDAKDTLAKVREVLDRLRKWHDWELRRRHLLRKHLLSIVFPRRPPCPSRDELKQLATFFFPSRASLIANICDYGEGRFQRSETPISKIEPAFARKPDWAIVRWIHVPVGLGIVHETLERSFLTGRDGQGLFFEQTGLGMACEVTSLRDKQYLQDQLDVFNMLRGFHDLTTDLDAENRWYSGLNEDIDDIARQYKIGTDFWQLGTTDIPWQLGEGTRFSLLDTDLGTNAVALTVEEQILSRHPRYEHSVLVRALFQCYNRTDGFVLSMSPTAGISTLDRTVLQDIQANPGTRAANEKASFIGIFTEKYSGSGTTNWPCKTPEYFIVDMLTELLPTPHSPAFRRTVPEIQNAYLPLVRDLKIRRGANFRRHESVNLVREYVTCMDEIFQIYSISERKLDFLERLKRDYEILDQDPDHAGELVEDHHLFNPLQPTANARKAPKIMVNKIDYAMQRIKASHEALPGILNDLRNSLDDLFQLRTIEQNELAIIAESNNKAILVFTVVTIIFLPLSFFTSYYGMNFKDGHNLLSGQGYFWGVCGSVTAIIVVFTLVYGFKDRIYGWIWSDRRSSLPQEYRRKRR